MKTFSPIQRFWRLLSLDKREISYIYFYALVSGLVSLSLPLGVQAITNLIQGGEISAAWSVLVALVIIGLIITGTLQVFQLRIVENIRQKIFARSSFEFAYRFPRMQLRAIHDHYYPELANRFFDTITLQKVLPKILVDFSIASIQIILGLILLAFYHTFFIVFGLVLLVLLMLIFSLSGPVGLRTSLQESKVKYKMAHWLEEIARSMTVFKLAGNTKYPLGRTDEYLKEYVEFRESHFKILVRQFIQFIGFKVLIAAGLLIIGSILVFNEQMNIGQFVAAEIIILIIISSVEKLVLVLENIYDLLTSLEKIAQVTDQPLEREGGIILPRRDKGIELALENTCFSYPDQPRNIIRNLDLHVNPGDRIYLTGTNGSGKSTLVKVLSGLFEVNSGHFLVDNYPLGSLDTDSFRSQIGVSISSSVVFKGSIFDNIVVGRSNIEVKDVLAAIEAVDLSEWLQYQQNSYQTIIDPEASRLPRSIIQKLLLARAIVGKPRLLILEDPLEFVDADSKRRVVQNVLSSENPWTLIVSSRDKIWMHDRSRILWMNQGQVQTSYSKEEFIQSPDFKNILDAEPI